MYADVVTMSMQNAIDETYRRRKIQLDYNTEHGIEALSIIKSVRDITDHVRQVARGAKRLRRWAADRDAQG